MEHLRPLSTAPTLAAPSHRELRRVLLVEDDEDDAIIVRDLLEVWPEVQVDVATTVAAAEARLSEGEVDCVLLDLGLPDASGIEAIERLQDLQGDVAFVVLTGNVDEQRGVAALGAGAQDYLVKGQIDSDSLVRAIRYAFERKSSERSRQELAVARTVEAENWRLQRGLLPAPIVDPGRFEIHTAYQPGSRRQLLGGDFFDVVQRPDGTVHAVIGDICGHGPDEAALGVRMRMAWRTLILAGTPEDELFGVLDGVLTHERDRPSLFTTLAHLELDAGCRSVEIRLAGHTPPILAGPDTPRLLDECAIGPALGLISGAQWPATRVELEGAWTLMLFTDGLYEGRNGDAVERLGTDGLLSLLQTLPISPYANGTVPLRAVINEVESRNGGALTDDVAMLSVSCDSDA